MDSKQQATERQMNTKSGPPLSGPTGQTLVCEGDWRASERFWRDPLVKPRRLQWSVDYDSRQGTQILTLQNEKWVFIPYSSVIADKFILYDFTSKHMKGGHSVIQIRADHYDPAAVNCMAAATEAELTALDFPKDILDATITNPASLSGRFFLLSQVREDWKEPDSTKYNIQHMYLYTLESLQYPGLYLAYDKNKTTKDGVTPVILTNDRKDPNWEYRVFTMLLD
ncbi:uncharacterized protein [Amphiura filiformis]|uniref:uncharacterized protein n=1 Tax=Amphiura filiformis TaxID=82378 RepID=UPI003B2219C0